jgi:hypothetical protein
LGSLSLSLIIRTPWYSGEALKYYPPTLAIESGISTRAGIKRQALMRFIGGSSYREEFLSTVVQQSEASEAVEHLMAYARRAHDVGIVGRILDADRRRQNWKEVLMPALLNMQLQIPAGSNLLWAAEKEELPRRVLVVLIAMSRYGLSWNSARACLSERELDQGLRRLVQTHGIPVRLNETATEVLMGCVLGEGEADIQRRLAERYSLPDPRTVRRDVRACLRGLAQSPFLRPLIPVDGRV